PTCHAAREVPCPQCHGNQFVTGTQGRKTCTRCQGRGRIGCLTCKRTGYISCTRCRNTGRVSCQYCSGTGWHSHMNYLEVRAKGRFVYDRESLPEELPPLIDRLGPDMVKEGHAIITITEDKEREEEL